MEDAIEPLSRHGADRPSMQFQGRLLRLPRRSCWVPSVCRGLEELIALVDELEDVCDVSQLISAFAICP